MKYAGFWLRLGATLIDILVLVPFILLYYYFRSISWTTAVVVQIPYLLLWPVYNTYFLARWGQTIGKMAMRIKVVSLYGSQIGYKQAVYRHIVDFLFAIITRISLIVALFSVPAATFESLGWQECNKVLYNATPSWGFWAEHASSVWICSEMIVLLFNDKKRAIHDFIACTVVIRKEHETL